MQRLMASVIAVLLSLACAGPSDSNDAAPGTDLWPKTTVSDVPAGAPDYDASVPGDLPRGEVPVPTDVIAGDAVWADLQEDDAPASAKPGVIALPSSLSTTATSELTAGDS